MAFSGAALIASFFLLIAPSMSTCPSSITQRVTEGRLGLSSELAETYETLKSCPQVQSLDLTVSWGGCVVEDFRYANFPFQQGDTLPPLRELRLHNYNFDEFIESRPLTWWDRTQALLMSWFQWKEPTLSLPASESGLQPMANLRKWKAAMDWTKLQRLEIVGFDDRFFVEMHGELPGLQSLNVAQGDSCGKFDNFLLSLNPLPELSVQGCTKSVNWSQVLEHHGSSITRLEIRQRQSLEEFPGPRPTLSVDHLRAIKTWCPSLSALSVYAVHNVTELSEVLTSIASNKKLTKLELWFEGDHEFSGDEFSGDEFSGNEFLGDGNSDDEPYVKHWETPLSTLSDFSTDGRLSSFDSAIALHIFRYLRSMKKGSELLELTLSVGSDHYTQWDYDWPLMSDSWFCSVLRKDGSRKGEGEGWCY